MSLKSKAELAALIERVQAATGPDITLDFGVHDAVYGSLTPGVVPRYTSSLDAVVGLVEGELPGTEWSASTIYGAAWAEVGLNHHNGPHQDRRTDCNVTLSLLTAFLKSKAAGNE